MDSNGADSNGAVVDVVPDIAVDAVLDLDEAEEALISARTAPDDELQLLPAGDASPPPNAVDQPWVGDDAPAKGSSESNRAKPDSSEGKYGVDDLDDTFNNKRPVVPAGRQEIRLFMLVRGFPKFNRMGRRDSLWNILNEESPSSAARRGRGPLKKLALKLAGDPAEEPTWTNGKFLEVLVILCIVLNTLILAIQHPSNTYPDEFNNFMNVMDLVLTSIFTAEMFIKIMAYGLYKGTPELPSYLSDSWNRLDFVVVIISWVSVLVEALELELPIKVSTLRALRIMRVLKSLRFFTGIKMILVTLARAAASMTTIVGFLAFVFTIAGIVGIQMFRGTVNWRCSKVAPTPDVSGLDWISLGIGDVTYRKHCVPDLEFPRCPEFPPCNVAYDRFTLEPIVDTLDNGVTWGEQIFETSGSRKRGWIRRSEGWRENATDRKSVV